MFLIKGRYFIVIIAMNYEPSTMNLIFPPDKQSVIATLILFLTKRLYWPKILVPLQPAKEETGCF